VTELHFKVLQAMNGDSLLISINFTGAPRNLLIDGGPSTAYKQQKQRKGDLYKALTRIKDMNQRIDLLVLTHVDDDHVGGILKGFKDEELLAELTDKVWYNSGALIDKVFEQPIDESHYLESGSVRTGTNADNLTSIRQGVSFEEIIRGKGIWDEQLIHAVQFHEFYGAKITILSPTHPKLEKLLIKWKKEEPSSLTGVSKTDYESSFDELLCDDQFNADSSIHNGSSIALLFELEEKRLLLLGDAHDEAVVESIRTLKDQNGVQYSEENPLTVDYVKLAHHGSQRNTSTEFLSLIKCNHFIVSTNGIRHGLPNKRTLARIAKLHPNATVWFNYKSTYRAITKTLTEKDANKVSCIFKCSSESFEV